MKMWHIITKDFYIGLMKEGTKEQVAQELKDAFVRQIDAMSLESFINRCNCELRRFVPETDWKPPKHGWHTQQLIDDGYKTPGQKIGDEKKEGP